MILRTAVGRPIANLRCLETVRRGSSARWQPISSLRAAVTKALEEFIARRRQKKLLDLLGKLEWDSSYNCKDDRSLQ